MVKGKINVKEKIIVTLALAAALAAAYLLRLPCPSLSLLGVPCPTCGMTRAYLSLLRFDIAEAFGYHPLFWTIPLLYAFFLFDGRIFKKKWLNVVAVCVLCALLAARWIWVVSRVFLPTA